MVVASDESLPLALDPAAVTVATGVSVVAVGAVIAGAEVVVAGAAVVVVAGAVVVGVGVVAAGATVVAAGATVSLADAPDPSLQLVALHVAPPLRITHSTKLSTVPLPSVALCSWRHAQSAHLGYMAPPSRHCMKLLGKPALPGSARYHASARYEHASAALKPDEDAMADRLL